MTQCYSIALPSADYGSAILDAEFPVEIVKILHLSTNKPYLQLFGQHLASQTTLVFISNVFWQHF